MPAEGGLVALKPPVGPLVGERLRLRLLEERDLEMTLAWRNQDDIRRWFVHSDPLALDAHRAWFDRYQQRDDDFLFLIEEIDRLRKPIGQAGLYHIDRDAGRAEFGRILIGEPDARGSGFAREATALLLSLALDHWGLDAVDLEVFHDNLPALQTYRRVGFEATHEADGLIRMQVTGPQFHAAHSSAS